MKKKFFVMLLTISIVLGFGVTSFAADITGSGTAIDPYVIWTLQGLNQVRNDMSAHYKLGCDIDASETSTWNGGKGFNPIGDMSNPFIGWFQGEFYKITNLYINRPSEDYVGLFGIVHDDISNPQHADIRYVGLENVYIVGRNYVGGIAGKINSWTFENYVTGYIKGNNYVGGLAGYHHDWNNNLFADCYSKATVIGNSYVGGILGYGNNLWSSNIENSYYAGNITYSSSGGPIIGYNKDMEITGCYWDKDVTGISSSATGGTGLTTSQMKDKDSFVGWDWNVNNYWSIKPDRNDGYPYLSNFVMPLTGTPVSSVSLNNTSTTLDVGASETITATVLPVGATNKNVIWSSDTLAVATVDNLGEITAVAEGTATITAMSDEDNSIKDTCIVTVIEPVIEVVNSVILDKERIIIREGEIQTLTATIDPFDIINNTIVWTSSDESVATVDNIGNVTGVSKGIVAITAKSQEDLTKEDTCEVTIVQQGPLFFVPEDYEFTVYMLSEFEGQDSWTIPGDSNTYYDKVTITPVIGQGYTKIIGNFNSAGIKFGSIGTGNVSVNFYVLPAPTVDDVGTVIFES